MKGRKPTGGDNFRRASLLDGRLPSSAHHGGSSKLEIWPTAEFKRFEGRGIAKCKCSFVGSVRPGRKKH
eukprot:4225522-Pyramimonas_sp.AAC.1